MLLLNNIKYLCCKINTYKSILKIYCPHQQHQGQWRKFFSSTKIYNNKSKSDSSIVEIVRRQTETSNNGLSEWTPIYQLPYIQLMATINKLKIYQTFFAVTTIPLSFGFETLGYIESGYAPVFTVLGVSGMITLYLFGLITTNLIGRIYVNINNKKVKISYINFWGYRKDVELAENELIPLMGGTMNRRNIFYSKIYSFANEKSYKLMLPPFGTITNAELFIQNIGEV